MAHTPGPWQIDAESNIGHFEIWGGSIEDSAPLICFSEGFEENAAESKANARLIAAAPEMLEALQAIEPMGDNDENGWFDCWEKVRSAIAKATDNQT